VFVIPTPHPNSISSRSNAAKAMMPHNAAGSRHAGVYPVLETCQWIVECHVCSSESPST